MSFPSNISYPPDVIAVNTSLEQPFTIKAIQNAEINSINFKYPGAERIDIYLNVGGKVELTTKDGFLVTIMN